jgi:hypothetical protein
MKLFAKNEGAITIFLSVILVAVLLVSQILIDALRVQTAKTQVESGLSLAMSSALSSYNNNLKDMYGLMAVEDEEKIQEEVQYYLERTLGINSDGYEKSDIEKVEERIKESINKIRNKEVKYTDLYKFRIEDDSGNTEGVNVELDYDLADFEVLQAQILEYMKYRGPKEIGEELIEKFLNIAKIGESTKVIKKKVEIEKKIDKLTNKKIDLTDKVIEINTFPSYSLSGKKIDEKDDKKNDKKNDKNSSQSVSTITGYKFLLKNYANKLSYSKELEFYGNVLTEQISRQTKLAKNIRDYSTQISIIMETPLTSPGEAIARERTLENYRTMIENASEKIQELQEEIAETRKIISEYEEKLSKEEDEFNKGKELLENHIKRTKSNIESAMESIVDLKKENIEINNSVDKALSDVKVLDDSNFKESMEVGLKNNKESVENKNYDRYNNQIIANQNKITLIENNLKKLDMSTFTEFYNSSERLNTDYAYEKVSSVCQLDKIIAEMDNYYGYGNPKNEKIEFYKEGENNGKENLKKLTIKDKEEKPEKTEPVDKLVTIETEDYDNLPSNPNNNKEEEQIDTSVKEFDLSSMYDFNLDSLFGGIIEIKDKFANGLLGIRNSLYINEYCLGYFKNTSTPERYKLDPSKNIFYALNGDKLYPTEQGRESYFHKGEIEYILIGNESERFNINAVAAQILLIRFALNAIAIYTIRDNVLLAGEIATAIVGFTGIGIPVLQALILIGWAFLEAGIDLDLLNSGHEVPLFKSRENWVSRLGGSLIEYAATKGQEVATEKANQGIDYLTNVTNEKVKNFGDQLEEEAVKRIETSLDNMFSKIIEYADHNLFDAWDEINKKVGENIENTVEFEQDLRNSFESQFNINVELDILENQASNVGFEILKNRQDDIKALLEDLEIKEEQIALGNYANIKEKLDNIKNENRKAFEAKINEIKAEVVNKLKDKISALKTKYDKAYDETMSAVNKSAKEQVDKVSKEFFKNVLSNKPKIKSKNTGIKPKTKNNMSKKMITLDYEDYLRFLLLIKSNETKVKRISDLIQLNVRTRIEDDEYKMEDMKTRLHVKGTLSMKYWFMTGAFIPKDMRVKGDNRHKISVDLYKGY